MKAEPSAPGQARVTLSPSWAVIFVTGPGEEGSGVC